MAKTSDIISASIVATLFFAVVVGCIVSQTKMKQSLKDSKLKLKSAGLEVDARGIKIRSKGEAVSRDEQIQRSSHMIKTGGQRLLKTGAVSTGGKSAYQGKKPDAPLWAK